MNILLTVIGAVLAALGVVLILQGFSVLSGGPIDGHMSWGVYGAMAVTLGAGVVLLARRWRCGGICSVMALSSWRRAPHGVQRASWSTRARSISFR